MSGQADERFLLWVDAVGGYLVSLNPVVVLGQAVPGNAIDIPIQGDLARRHATIRRDSEGYLLTAEADVRINGVRVRGSAALSDGAVVELGPAVKLRFRLPHPLSATAQLLPLSHHRTRPATDGVLLLADTCIMGSGSACHIVARHFTREVLLFRRDKELLCRSGGSLEIDGVTYRGEGMLTKRSRVSGEHFSFNLETID